MQPLLRRWFGHLGLPAFLPPCLDRQPAAAVGTALGAESRFGWSELEGVLGSRNADVVVVSRGQPLDYPAPRDLARLREYFDAGIGLTVRSADRCSPFLQSVGAALERELGPSRVHLFATPAKSYGFGWHYDEEHVFIVQTAGIKDYFFRANTVAADRPASGEAFSTFSEEGSRLWTARLIAGDVLYLPARWWHMAKCVQDSLSISIGVSVSRARVERGLPAGTLPANVGAHGQAAPEREVFSA